MNTDDVENIFPLSGMQQLFLLHALRPGRFDQGFLHYRCAIAGVLDAGILEQAWGMVAARCDALRTSFVWEGFPEPLQVVQRTIALPWKMEDWSQLEAGVQPERLAQLIADDRVRGIDLNAYPLSRLTLVRMSERHHVMLWSHHHIQTDGWSVAVIIRELFACYAALRSGGAPVLEPRRPFSDYIAWLLQRDLGAAEAYWRALLGGFTSPTTIARHPPSPARSSTMASARKQLPAAVLAGLATLARTHNVTINTVTQAAWALVLAHHSGSQDVVFGTTVSGRPPGLPGVEHMVGAFINNLPVRLQIKPQERIGA